MRTRPLTIQGITFDCPAPHSPGDVLTEHTANTLNLALGMAIRSNWAPRAKAFLDEFPSPDPDDLARHRKDFNDYVTYYISRSGPPSLSDAILAEARVVAESVLRTRYSIARRPYPGDAAWEQEVHYLMNDANTIREADARLRLAALQAKALLSK